MQFTTIRPQEEDIDRLADLYRECRRASDMPILPDYFKSLPEWVFSETWKSVFLNSAYRAKLAVIDGRWIGFYVVGAIDEDFAGNLKNVTLPEHCGELHQIYLLPDYYAKGIGKTLYEEARQDLKELGHTHFISCTYQENEKAKSFYQAIGAKHLKDDVLGAPWHRAVTFYIDAI